MLRWCHRMIRLIEGNAKCHKKLTCKGPFQPEYKVKYSGRKSAHIPGRLHGNIEWRGEVNEGGVAAGRRAFFPPRIFQFFSPMSVPGIRPPPPNYNHHLPMLILGTYGCGLGDIYSYPHPTILIFFVYRGPARIRP